MTVYVLDASALIAVIKGERGAGLVESRIPGAFMSSVNASETIMRSVEFGYEEKLVTRLISALKTDLVPFDADLAVAAARLRRATRHRVLSFADRACLATAIRLGATAVTADRAWADLDLPCPVELIR